MVTRVKGVTVGKLNRVSGQRGSRAKSGSVGAAATAKRSDDVIFSSDALTIGKADEVIGQTPEVRMDVVEPIREAMNAGRYHVSSLDVADKILRQVLMDRKKSF